MRQARSFFEQHATVVYPCSVPQGDGRWMRLEVTMVPDAGPDGQVRGAYVLMTDITQRYETERALRESEDRLARFMEASAEGVLFHADGVITIADSGNARILEIR